MRKWMSVGAVLAAAVLFGCSRPRPVVTVPMGGGATPIVVPGGGGGPMMGGRGNGRTNVEVQRPAPTRDSEGRTRGGFSTPSGTGNVKLVPQGGSGGKTRVESGSGDSGTSSASGGKKGFSFSRPPAETPSAPAPSGGGGKGFSRPPAEEPAPSSSGGGRKGFSRGN